jgi:hypothetical protein
MFRISLPKCRSLTVTAVANDLATLEGLGVYLTRRVSFRAVDGLTQAFVLSAASDVVLFYPDGFPTGVVQKFARRLLGNATLSLVILATRRPDAFLPLASSRAFAHKVIVLPAPAWPWELFATIHSSLPAFRRSAQRLC